MLRLQGLHDYADPQNSAVMCNDLARLGIELQVDAVKGRRLIPKFIRKPGNGGMTGAYALRPGQTRRLSSAMLHCLENY